MALRITIDIFSGRPNPVIELSGKAAQEVLARVQPGRSISRDAAEVAETSLLGYRGLVIDQVGTRSRSLPTRLRVVDGNLLGAGLAHRATDEGFEEFFVSKKGYVSQVKGIKNFRAFLTREMTRARQARDKMTVKPIPFPLKPVCKCAPLYEPAWWNDGGQKQLNNNCYNYATNYRTDTFAQPGRAAGAMYSTLTCAAVRPAAVKDDLIDKPGANNKCPDEGHLVALVVAPGFDYHWYRKGRNGRWTHKPGSTPVTNVDNSNNPILGNNILD